jgi:Bacterial Ig-like domain (group 3)
VTLADTTNPATSLGGEEVSFATDSGPSSFTPSSCTVDANGTCSVLYNAAEPGSTPRSDHLTATYAGKPGTFTESRDSASIEVTPAAAQHATTAALACEETAIFEGGSSVCTVTVRDGADPKTTPSGEVSFSSDRTGAFSASGACSLNELAQGEASCQLIYTPAAGSAGTHHIDAEYQGDSEHEKSSPAQPFALEVVALAPGAHATTLALECKPTGAILGGATVCTVRVHDTAADPSAPLGGVVFASDSAGTFSPGGCVLFATGADESRCQVLYEPTRAQVAPHRISAAYSGEPSHRGASDSVDVAVSAPNGGHHTSTSVLCNPASAEVGTPMPCTATVENTDQSPASPGGTVVFASAGAGSFGSGGCVLAEVSPGKASCTVTYTGLAAGEPELSAIYGGDNGTAGVDPHEPSSGKRKVTVNAPPPPPAHPTATTISCQPAPLVLGSGASNCTISVEDTEPAAAPSHPSGEVTIQRLSGEGQLSAASCQLPENAQAKASCAVVAYTPARAGEHQLKASYEGDGTHAKSSATATLAVSAAQTKTTLACTPGKVLAGAPATCTVTVAAAQGGAAPTGTVKFASDSQGAFSAGGACTLAAAGGQASCQLTYTPGAAGSGTHKLTAAYQGDADHAASQEATQLQVGSAPDTKITKRPRRKTAARAARFAFTSSQAGSSFKCKLDRKPLKSCRSPFKARRLRPGRHVFSVQAVNADGVADPTPARYRWKVLGHRARKQRPGKKH